MDLCQVFDLPLPEFAVGHLVVLVVVGSILPVDEFLALCELALGGRIGGGAEVSI